MITIAYSNHSEAIKEFKIPLFETSWLSHGEYAYTYTSRAHVVLVISAFTEYGNGRGQGGTVKRQSGIANTTGGKGRLPNQNPSNGLIHCFITLVVICIWYI